jgi:hypothetical protein
MRARGARRSSEHAKRRFGAPHPSAPAGAYPLDGAAPRHLSPHPAFDQGRLPSCVAHALAKLIAAGLSTLAAPFWIPSMGGLYKCALSIEQPGTAPLIPTGLAIADAMTAAGRVGIRPMAPLVTPDGRRSDLWGPEDLEHVPNAPPPNASLRPTFAEDLACAKTHVLGPEEIQPDAADFEDHAAACIGVDGFGLVVGLHMTPSLEQFGERALGEDDVFTDDDSKEFTEEDLHAMDVMAYRTVPEGLEFWLGNSWGTWGTTDGGVWVTGADLRRRTVDAWKGRVMLASGVAA